MTDEAKEPKRTVDVIRKEWAEAKAALAGTLAIARLAKATLTEARAISAKASEGNKRAQDKKEAAEDKVASLAEELYRAETGDKS